uniref:Alpha-1,6-mannosyl-glycoprotein 2-beta-N-acetylglucosaminyltransferase n=1 Tax=Phallusia mammillata TaxID=59560 RepID=A0A6F9DLL3_9ASCI|nr:alpha-1,6-mannosyl-glycoprotein 2-beta-N-acetylglucosaminyltransferase-like [Phallusia mammillata]
METMAFRRSKLKILVLCAIGITLFALYQRYGNSNNSTVRETKKQQDKVVKDEKIKVPSPVEVAPDDEIVEKSDNTMPYDKMPEEMRQYVLSQNFVQDFHNTEKYGKHTQDSIIIVVQVHDRVDFFEQLLDSLKNARGIEKATLVLSMDKFTRQNEEAIKKIDFCRYINIFFPYSMQFYPKSFPGEDPNDCQRDWSKAEALKRNCNNAEYPDLYGHYREVKFVQIKHHWMWKLHMAFSGIRAFAGNTAPVLLLEEDYYVAPDVLFSLTAALEIKEQRCSKCQTISLGNYNPPNYSNEGNHLEIKSWTSSSHNMGMVITRAFYNKLVDCTDKMCDYDDYNWDWSLQAAASTCIADGLKTMLFKATRVFHIGSCGTHHKSDCNAREEAQSAIGQFRNAQLFPDSLHIALDSSAAASSPKPNGGWGDLRDHTLCKQYKSLCETTRG